jgi:hypothetical protein
MVPKKFLTYITIAYYNGRGFEETRKDVFELDKFLPSTGFLGWELIEPTSGASWTDPRRRPGVEER